MQATKSQEVYFCREPDLPDEEKEIVAHLKKQQREKAMEKIRLREQQQPDEKDVRKEPVPPTPPKAIQNSIPENTPLEAVIEDEISSVSASAVPTGNQQHHQAPITSFFGGSDHKQNDPIPEPKQLSPKTLATEESSTTTSRLDEVRKRNAELRDKTQKLMSEGVKKSSREYVGKIESLEEEIETLKKANHLLASQTKQITMDSEEAENSDLAIVDETEEEQMSPDRHSYCDPSDADLERCFSPRRKPSKVDAPSVITSSTEFSLMLDHSVDHVSPPVRLITPPSKPADRVSPKSKQGLPCIQGIVSPERTSSSPPKSSTNTQNEVQNLQAKNAKLQKLCLAQQKQLEVMTAQLTSYAGSHKALQSIVDIVRQHTEDNPVLLRIVEDKCDELFGGENAH